ncbi:hypothetical protein B0H63DRAFT_467346 [Podospora didyma]|uniref:Uncharacterized protein n=1 Tax=Podospora didyma TaxID=330526 RepID=A0AAE0P0N1_9PEZI|nr:hypothetical protein B0H63DRAFT_467346 [Podospora didyma]
MFSPLDMRTMWTGLQTSTMNPISPSSSHTSSSSGCSTRQGSTSTPEKDTPNYRPPSLTWRVLIPFGLYICGLITIIGYGSRVLPSSQGRRVVPQDDESEPRPAVLSVPLLRARETARSSKTSLPVPNDAVSSRLTAAFPTAKTTAGLKQTTPSGAVRRSAQELDVVLTALNITIPDPHAPETNSSYATTQQPFRFAEHDAYPPGHANLSLALRASLHRPRAQDPSHYGQLGGESQIIMFGLTYWEADPHHRNSPGRGKSYIKYFADNLVYFFAWDAKEYPEITFEGHCQVTCYGSALVFHERDCWDSWRSFSAIETEARKRMYDWSVWEKANEGAQVCKATPKKPEATTVVPPAVGGDDNIHASAGSPKTAIPTPPVPLAGPFPITATDISSFPLMMFTTVTQRDSQGSPTATVTAVLPINSEGLVTLVDAKGLPTATITAYEQQLESFSRTVMTLRDSRGSPTATLPLAVVPSVKPNKLKGFVTLTNSNGVPTATLPAQGGPVYSEMAITLTNAFGLPTTTKTLLFPVATVLPVTTLTDSDGVPTATQYRTLGPIPPSSTDIPDVNSTKSSFGFPASSLSEFHPLSRLEYFIALFLPVLLATPLSILAQMVSSDIKALLPFHALLARRQAGGATAEQSLCMSTSGMAGLINSVRLLFRFGEPLSFLGDLLVLFSALVTSLSSEAVGIKLYGRCVPDDFSGCYMGITVTTGPTWSLVALLASSLVAIFWLSILLRQWQSGVASAPGSIAGTASLVCQDPEMRHAFREIGRGRTMKGGHISSSEISETLRSHRFSLKHLRDRSNDFGIVATRLNQSKPARGELRGPVTWESAATTSPTLPNKELVPPRSTRTSRRGLLNWPPTTTKICSINSAAILLLCGLIILLVYYESTTLDTPFERFMDNQGFGVRVLFTGIGVAISMFWDYHFSRATIMEPYRCLSSGAPQLAKDSVLVVPRTSVFTGLIPAGVRRREIFVTAVGLATLLSKLTPILLSTIPFSPSQTWTTHLVCAWMSVACLCFMVLVLLYGTIFVKYPHMPVHPGSLAGRIYYVCHSAMLDDFHGMSLLSGREFDGRVRRLLGGKRFAFGEMVGVSSGYARIGVDYAPGTREED